MPAELRKSGVEFLGDIPWGSHFCQFYETKKDLLELLVPYFRAGLENNEYCLWIIADPMTTKDALHALEKNVPHFQQYLEKKSIEILPYMDWFMPAGKFDAEKISNAWILKLDEALARGYDGMRINGNETWLERNGWDNFMEYEQGLNNILKDRPVIGLCTYPLSRADAGMVLDVGHSHESVIAKRKGKWEILEQPEIKKLKAELQQRGDRLEQRVAERTRELEKLVEQLRWEISERQKAEEKVRQNERLLAQAEKIAHIGSWSLDLLSNTVIWSDELYRMFGINKSEFDHTLQAVFDLVHPDDRNFVKRVVEQAIKTHEPYDFHFRRVKPDKEVRIIHARGAVITDEQGNAVRMYGASQDVTELKQAQDELQMVYKRLSYHVENTPLAVIEWDKDLNITRWSGQAEKIFGWKASEVLGINRYDPDFRIVYKEDEAQVERVDHELMNGLVDRNLSLNRNYTKDGKVIYCEWYNSVLRDDKGKVITILSLIHDVTERKKAEEQLSQSYEQIRSLSEHLGSIREEERKYIAREIHDELGQYLTVLKMDVGAICKKIHVTDPVVQNKLKGLSDIIDKIVYSVRRIALELRPSMLDDLGLEDAMAWHLEEVEKQSGIKTSFKGPGEEWELSEPIKTHLFRIFQESLTNVVRHSKATEARVELTKKDGGLLLTITDNGIGFNPEDIDKGKTLGILGMKERAAIIGATYEIQSKPAEGTRITVTVQLTGTK